MMTAPPSGAVRSRQNHAVLPGEVYYDRGPDS
jgi:hypothetical protein